MRSAIVNNDYFAVSTFEGALNGQRVTVATKTGLPGDAQVSPSSALLAGAAECAPDARVLVLGAGHGALGVALARRVPAGHVTLLDPSVLALDLCDQTLRLNNITNATVLRDITMLPEHAASFDVVLIELPKGRKLLRRWLVEAHAALRPGGAVYLAGPNDEGIQSALADARALFGNLQLLATKHRCRVGMARKHEAPTAPEWASEPGIAPGTWRVFGIDVGGVPLELATLPGVFAADRLDDGTRLLLAHLPATTGLRVLDVGCGCGVIGIVAAQRGAAQVDMLDANLLAVAAAERNIAAYSLPHARALPSDTLAAVVGATYDLVLSNPPFHEGKAVDYDVAHAIIAQARAALAPGGQLVLVANRFLRYEHVMEPLFGEVERVADDGRYHVLAGRA